MNVLVAKNLTKKFGSFTAVNNISFLLKEGEILGVLGPNGAGKTTIIQMLLGVLTPTSGEINYFGKSLDKHREEILEKLNFSSTYVSLPRRLTIRENLTFISFLYSILDRKKRINQIKELFKLEEFWNKGLFSLSAGQQTRVNLAKAFINFPKVLLLDEPTASLDPEIAVYIRKFLLKERKKFNLSILITSHNMAEVEEICDRVIFINRGQIISKGTPYELAKTIDLSHVSLLIKDGLKRTIKICEQQKLNYHLEARYIVISLKEKDIPYFLKNLLEMGIVYEGISIDKPSLEDYFLKVARDK